MDMKEVVFKNKKIRYRSEGKGKHVILLHGFAEDGRLWDPQVKALKKHFHFIIPDIPGSGSSEMILGKVSLAQYADAMKAIADAEIMKRPKTFTLIGHSMGGYISMAFAEKYPELLNGLGLFHSTSYADDEPKKEIRNKGIDFIKKNGAASFLKNTVQNLFSEKSKKDSPQLIERLLDISKDFTPAALIQYYQAMRDRPDHSSVLQKFQKPVLFIQGMHDNAVPLKSGLAQSHSPAICFFKILNDSAHMGMWEEDQEATAYMKYFLMNT